MPSLKHSSLHSLPVKSSIATILGFALATLSGCGLGNMLPSSDASDPASAARYTITGTVHGPIPMTGHNARPKAIIPISGATVYLYAAGISGYGSAATLLAETTTATDGSASFSFTQDPTHTNSYTNISNTYSCPSYTFTSPDGTTSITKDSLIYLVAYAGDTADGGSGSAHTNSSSVIMAALGDCNSASSLFVNVGEATTVASVFSLASYISPIYPTASITLTPYGAAATATLLADGVGSIAITTGGYLYTSAPNVVITDPAGVGTGATATATVAGGAITGITVTNAGSGYATAPTISFTSTNVPNTATLYAGALGTSTSYMTGYGLTANGGYTSTGTKKSVATSPLGYTGMLNAFATVNKLVSLASGLALPSFASTVSLGSSSVTITGTPEQAKLNTIADIIAGCVDSSSTGTTASAPCTTLFSYAKPPISWASTSLAGTTTPATPPSATDTFQAAWNMATNPTDNTVYGASTTGSSTNLGNLFANVTNQSNFQPTLGSAQPTDWTLSIAYSSTSTCGTDTTKSAFFGVSPYIAVSGLDGSVAMINGDSGSDNTAVILSNGGTPVDCLFGQYTKFRGLAYDTNGNLWGLGAFTGSATSSNLFKTTGIGTYTSWTAYNGTTYPLPYTLTADGSGNILYTVDASGGTIQKFSGAAAATTPTYSAQIGSVISSTTTRNLYSFVPDDFANIWVADNSLTSGPALTALEDNAGTYTNYSAGSTANTDNPWGIAADSPTTSGGAYHVFAGNTCCTSSGPTNSVTRATTNKSGANVSFTTTLANSTRLAGGVIGSTGLVLDGAGNVWVTNRYASSSYPSGSKTFYNFAVAELDNNLNALAPNGSTTPACSAGGAPAGCLALGGYVKSTLGTSVGPVVDISGNVWVPSDLSANTGSASATNGNLVELVGAAVPTVQPMAVAARDGKLATKP